MASTKTKAQNKPGKANNKPAKEAKLLNKPQTFILKVLKKTNGALTRPVIAERAAKIGASTSRGRISDEAGNYGYLVENGFIREHEANPEADLPKGTYSITAAGAKALQKV